MCTKRHIWSTYFTILRCCPSFWSMSGSTEKQRSTFSASPLAWKLISCLRTTPGLIDSMMLVEPIISIVYWQVSQRIARQICSADERSQKRGAAGINIVPLAALFRFLACSKPYITVPLSTTCSVLHTAGQLQARALCLSHSAASGPVIGYAVVLTVHIAYAAALPPARTVALQHAF